MDDNKEHSQLLPFHKSDDRAADGQDDLQQLLQKVRLPDPSEELDRRILSSYDDQIGHRSFWKRLVIWTIPVPVPIAALIVLSIVPLIYLAIRPDATLIMETPLPKSVEQVRIVEVPVIKERVVTRTVYIDRKSGPSDNPARQTSIENVEGQSRLELSGFKLVDELKIRLLDEGEKHEK